MADFGGASLSPGQRLLLRAALDSAAPAEAAWRAWYAEFGLAAPDEGSFRLLPLVFSNLERLGIDAGPEREKLRGIHRLAWSRNQWLFHQVRPLVAELRDAGIPVLFLKGVALALRVYPDPGARPMRDVDLLVPAAHARRLLELLQRRGWRALHWLPRQLHPSFFGFRHAMDFENSSRSRLDLHWHVLPQCCHARFDELFWRAARTFDFLGIEGLIPDPAEQLLQICAHGIVWSPVPSVRWVADAILLLRSAPVDWPRLSRAAQLLDIAPYVETALRCLRREWDAPVPAEVLDDLSRTRCGAGTRAEFARETAPFASRSAWNDLLTFYARWRRSLGGASPLLRPAGFARHLQYAFELDGLSQLPAQLARSAWRRLHGCAAM